MVIYAIILFEIKKRGIIMSNSVFDKKGGALKNIRFFDACVVFVANKLYSEFPRCVDVNTYEAMEDEYFKALDFCSDKEIVMTHTLFWLKENGFLTFTEPCGQPDNANDCTEQFTCVRLTAKGFSILKSPTPKSVNGGSKNSLGSVIQNSIIDKGMNKAVDAAFSIVSSLVV